VAIFLFADFRLATTLNSYPDTDSLIKTFESTIRKFPSCAEGYALFGQVSHRKRPCSLL